MSLSRYNDLMKFTAPVTFERAFNTLLEKAWPYFPHTLAPTAYRRLQDDSDGARTSPNHLGVVIGDDGDCHVSTDGVRFLRFRTPLIGGGASPREHRALQVLAEAIRRDEDASESRAEG